MKKVDWEQLTENGDVDALEEERDFVRSMYRSGDLTAAQYAGELSKLDLLIGQANYNLELKNTTN